MSLDNLFLNNLALFIDDVNRPVVIHGSLLIYILMHCVILKKRLYALSGFSCRDISEKLDCLICS